MSCCLFLDFHSSFDSNIEDLINDAIANALKKTEEEGISGKEATPFLLSAIAKITEGKSLATSKFQ